MSWECHIEQHRIITFELDLESWVKNYLTEMGNALQKKKSGIWNNTISSIIEYVHSSVSQIFPLRKVAKNDWVILVNWSCSLKRPNAKIEILWFLLFHPKHALEFSIIFPIYFHLGYGSVLFSISTSLQGRGKSFSTSKY